MKTTSNKEKFLTNHGLPFDLNLAKALDSQLDRVQVQGKASCIIIEGGVGMGKTTLDVHVADYLTGAYEKIGLDEWKLNPDLIPDFKDYLGMGGKEFIKCMKVCYLKKIVVAVYDEAGDFSKRSTLTGFNALLNRVFDTYRAFKIIVVVSLPSFSYLDNALLEKQIPRFLIRVRSRNQFLARYDIYDLLTMFLIKYYMKKIPVSIQAYSRVRHNFSGFFYNLTPDRCKELDAYTTSGKFEILQLAEIKGRGLLSYNQLAGKLNRSVIWVKKKVSLFKIKPAETVKGKRYFDPEAISTLMSAIDKDDIATRRKLKKAGVEL